MWMWFEMMDLESAFAHVLAGGVAVHENGFGYKWAGDKRAAHLLAATDSLLHGAARRIGLNIRWFQRGKSAGMPNNGNHFDVKGAPLIRAFDLCVNAEAAYAYEYRDLPLAIPDKADMNRLLQGRMFD